MSLNYLEFEQPIAELIAKTEELQNVNRSGELDLDLEEQINSLHAQVKEKTEKIFANLSAWETAQVARHPLRPYTKDYIDAIFTEFDEMCGDRTFANDPAIIGGMARLDGEAVMVIGHQKGRDTAEKIKRNFGMSKLLSHFH